MRSGVRAMPPRTQDGKVPLAGRVPGFWLRTRTPPATSSPASAAGSRSPGPASAAGGGGSTQHTRAAGAHAGMSHGKRQAAGAVAEGEHAEPMPRGPDPDPKWWVLAGLGARGLTYHAWLGRHVAAAVLADDQGLLPRELRAWQQRLDVQADHAANLQR